MVGRLENVSLKNLLLLDLIRDIIHLQLGSYI